MDTMDLHDLPVPLDRASTVPLPAQVAHAVRDSVRTGLLAPGDRMPGSRSWARDLGLSRGTVEAAYEQLRTEGYLVTRARGGTFVDPDLPAVLRRAGAVSPTPRPERTGPRVRVDLRPGAGGEPIAGDPRFRAAWRHALDAQDPEGDARGLPRLREAISEHLRLMRGTTVDPDDVLVTAGSRDGLALVLRALRETGASPLVAVEDPGFPGLRRTLEGLPTVPVPVDGEGMDPDALDALWRAGSRPGALLLTPNHQFPHATSMPAARRAALAQWAEDHRVTVLEDDYDSEARYAGGLTPPLFELSRRQVAHIGTFSTVLTPVVSTGYVVATGRLGSTLRRLREAAGPVVPLLTQRAVAEYLGTGGLRTRIGRGRRRMRAAERVAAEFAHLPGLVRAGRSLVVETSAEVSRRLRADLAAHGVAVGDLAAGWSGDARRHGLVLAHPNAEPDDLRRVLTRIARDVGS
ncbi:PLP-dependent aminotransferase family protein [Brevibacterium litoralis]|uniref:MocR-like pyridoxine biosynthesis transcription factor PdxR n=1 Tax=Brevibacterium litoralis TaxID=3138935 RepID=UPI0032ED0466